MTPQLVIGTVHPDFIDAQFCRCVCATLEEDTCGRFPLRGRVLMARAPAGMLHVARNQVVKEFLAHPLSPRYLLFIDTDMAWTPDQVWALMDVAVAHDLPAVNALVVMQNGADPTSTLPVMYDESFHLLHPVEDVQRVFCAGMAFMLLRRDALEHIGRAFGWPLPWFEYGIHHGKAVTEEVPFSQRCWDLGIPIHVATTIRVDHRKIHPFRAADPVLAPA